MTVVRLPVLSDADKQFVLLEQQRAEIRRQRELIDRRKLKRKSHEEKL